MSNANPTKIINLLVIGLFSTYALKLFAAGELILYIHPRLVIFTAAMSALALIVAVVGLIGELRSLVSISKLKSGINSLIQTIKSDTKIYLAIGILLATFVVGALTFLFIPLILIPLKRSKLDLLINNISWLRVLTLIVLVWGFVLVPQTLSAQAAAQSSSVLNTLITSDAKVNTLALFNLDYSKYTIGDWIKTVNLNPDLQKYDGKPVDVVGFVFESDQSTGTDFLVSRFVISCCAVDARPIGLSVASADWKQKWKPGAWVRVVGTFHVISSSEGSTLQIEPTTIEPSVQPKDPYIY